jgi:hypothetical protein
MMTIAVEEILFGKLYRTLDAMPGVASITIHSEGVKGNGAEPKRKKQKQGGSQSVYCLVLGALASGPATRDRLAPVLEEAGKKGSSLPDALTKARKAKHITVKNAGKRDAVYTLTALGKKHYKTACEVEAA